MLNDTPEFCASDTFSKLLLKFFKTIDVELVNQMAENWTEITNKKTKTKEVAVHKMAKFYLERFPTEPPILRKPKTRKKKQLVSVDVTKIKK